MAYGIVNVERVGQSESLTVALGDVKNVTATAGNKQVILKWTDPVDATLEGGATLAKWAGTVVVRKAGSVPADRTDGTVVVISTTRNAYASTGYVDKNLTNGTVYYYRFFPYTSVYTYTTGSSVNARPYSVSTPVPTLTVPTKGYTYDGSAKTPTITYNNSYVNVSGTQSSTNAGNFSVTFTLKNTAEYQWSDGTYAAKTLTWSVAQAVGSITLASTTMKLTQKVTSDTIAITQVGNGALSATSSNSALITAGISGKTVQISRVGTAVGSATVTVKAAASTNYKAASDVTIAVTAVNYRTMTVTIDESDSNPATCCTYYDDAVDMVPGSDEWDEFFGHYPCLLANGTGVEGVKLNPNNFNKDVDGNTVTINGGTNDVMVAFPRHGLKMSKSGNKVTISMTDNPDDSNFEYMAHKRGDTLKDKFYIGAYMGYVDSNKMRSWSGKQPTGGKKHGEFETYATNNGKSNGKGGSGYNQHGYYQMIYLIAMYILKYKNLNSQTTIGNGVSYTSSDYSSYHGISTGGTETLGMDYGTTANKTSHMKLFGIEDLWGNLWSWIGGFWYSSDRHIWTATENFNSTGSGYVDRGASGATADIGWNWSTKIVGTTHGGFLTLSTSGGSATTFYCDRCLLNASRLLLFGGGWYDDSYAGVFCLHVFHDALDSYANLGSRLMYL